MNLVSYYQDNDSKIIYCNNLLDVRPDNYKHIYKIDNFIVTEETLDIIHLCPNLKCIYIHVNKYEALHEYCRTNFPLILLVRPFFEIILHLTYYSYNHNCMLINIYYYIGDTMKLYYNNSTEKLALSRKIEHLFVSTPSNDNWYNFENFPHNLKTLTTHTNVIFYDNLPVALKKFTNLYCELHIKVPYKCCVNYYKYSNKPIII